MWNNMASVRSLKRRLSSTSLIDKYKALKEIGGGQSCIATSRKYGVVKNTISHWIKQKQKIFEVVEENNVSKKRKRVKPATYEELDNATYKWLKGARDRNVPVGAKLKALEFAKTLDLGNFHASDGWMDRCKKRFNVSFKTIPGMFLFTKLESENS